MPGMRVALIAAVVLSVTIVPVAAQEDDSLVPQSLWGVKSSVGLGLVEEFLTNHGDRAFWQDRPSGDGARVAVVDTGIDPSHPDLAGAMACDHCWRDLVNDQAEPYDDHGHGTHVAGIIAAGGHGQFNPLNGYFPTGARGLAPDAGLIVAKAMNASGQSSDARVAEAVRWAVDPDEVPGSGDEPHVLHLSIAVDAPTDGNLVQAGSKTEDAVREAIEQGVHVVLSAGNQGVEGPANPGHVEGVVAVGALTSQGGVYEESNWGEGVDVFAPGVVLSTWPGGLDGDGIDDGYTGLAGTSQAAPVVSGAMALALGSSEELRSSSSATTVQHVASMVAETSRVEQASWGEVRVLDADALLASVDEGTSEVAGGVVAVLGVSVLLVVVLVGRASWRALGAFVEDSEEGLDEAPPEEGFKRAPPPAPGSEESRGEEAPGDDGGQGSGEPGESGGFRPPGE